MNLAKIIRFFLFITVLIIVQKTWAQNPENWTSAQLTEPSELAQVLQSGKDLPVIISVGPGAIIPKSIEAGMAKEKDNLDTLKKQINRYAKRYKN